MRTVDFEKSVREFVIAFEKGDSIEAVWEQLAEITSLNPADLQRAVDRARDLTAGDWDDP